MTLRAVLVAAMLAACGVITTTAQTAPSRLPVTTLSGWADATWLTLLDRDGSYFGRLAEQGTLQRFNRLMDHEYELDLETGLFSAAEDVRWAPVRSGFRGAGASISHPLLLTQVEWRQQVPVAGPFGFAPRYVRQHTLSARRDYLELEAEWRGPGSVRALRGGFGVHAFKASGDLQVAALLGSPDGRGWSATARVALVDAFTNPVFSLAANDPAQADTHFHYSTRPVAARLDLAWASRLVRFQSVTGVMRTSTVEITFPNTGDSSFTQRESFRFAAGLVELAPIDRFAIGFFGTTVRARTVRRFEAASTRGFDLFEETSSIGGRGRIRLDSALAVELDSRVTWRPERRDRADSVVRHRDREVLSQVVLIRRPPGDGWLGRLGVTADTRRAGVLAPQLHDSDSRLLTEFGWRFRSGFEASFGVRWDLDASGTFDGGHLRLIATW